MANKQTVCAVIVTYNRKVLLLECLSAILRQTYPLDAIYLIDNASTDGTRELLMEKGYIKNILEPTNEPLVQVNIVSMLSEMNKNKEVKTCYVRMHENTGGAGGFYEGVKRGHQNGYDWLWLMDDDAEPRPDCLEILFNGIANIQDDRLAGIAALNIDVTGAVQKLHRGFIDKKKWQQIPLSEEKYNGGDRFVKIDYSSFVGLLISSGVVERSGYPDKDFFIWFDDMEYCIRLAENGNIYLDKHAVIVHKDKLESEYMKDKEKDLWKRYYSDRNSMFLYKKYSKNNFFSWFELSSRVFKGLVYILLFENFKFKRIRLLLMAYYDILFDIRGRKVSPEF